MTKVLRRSPHAQLEAMRKLWPEFKGERHADGLLLWIGELRPKAQIYRIGVLWKPGEMALPYVMVLQPKVEPREGGKFEDIPHLLFDKKSPEQSGLCLFDPSGREWSATDLIAETTIKWVAEWLTYYELWHLTGEWLAPSVGYESVTQMMSVEQTRVIRQAVNNVH